MPGPLLLLLAQVATPAPATPAGDVVVIGRRAERELAACLARNCPPDQEVEAALQASVEQFADARYTDARRTLQRTIGRNKRHAAELPGPVSSLYATLATVAEHEGDTNLWRTASRNNVVILRKYLGTANTATLTQELSFADDMVGQGAIDLADGLYSRVQDRAAASGRGDLAANAAFRRAWLAMQRERFRDAQRFADTAVTLSGDQGAVMRELREIVRTRIAVRKGDNGAVDALVARLGQSSSTRPALIYTPPIDDINPPRGRLEPRRPLRDDGIYFADIGYWIRPDGKVMDVEMLRTNGLGQWKTGILHHVSQRRYMPLKLTEGQPGLYRIDRFTVRGDMDVPIGTRIRQRMGNLSIHVVDLTETEALRATQQQRVAQRTALAGPATQP